MNAWLEGSADNYRLSLRSMRQATIAESAARVPLGPAVYVVVSRRTEGYAVADQVTVRRPSHAGSPEANSGITLVRRLVRINH